MTSSFSDVNKIQIYCVTYLYIRINKNQSIIDPHVAKWVTHVQEFIINPAFPHTVTTTYYKKIKYILFIKNWFHFDSTIKQLLNWNIQCIQNFLKQCIHHLGRLPISHLLLEPTVITNKEEMNVLKHLQSTSKIPM